MVGVAGTSASRHARIVVDELVRGGVREAVLCPGSRNAPLALALHAADAAERLRLHVRIDERGAGFLALGLAVRSRRPVPVATTSGTAVANLHPAVLEASHAGVGLVVLSADRPPELIGTGANQTVVQPGLFGDAVRLAVVAAVGPDPRHARAAVARVLAAAVGARGAAPGPVQLNLAFAEPLLPTSDEPEPDGAGAAGRPGGAPWTAVPPVRRDAPPLPLDPAAPTLLLAGSDGDPGDGPVLPADVPVVAEPVSSRWPSARRTGPWLLDEPALRPRQVVVLGRPTLHRSVARLLADTEVAVYAVADPAGGPWTDVPGTVRAVGSLPASTTGDPEFAARWVAADAAASTALDHALDPGGFGGFGGSGGTAPVGLRLARDLVAALPAGALLLLGSSNPIRDVALAAVPRPGLKVLANRGVAGIDGTVSTAVGAALAHPGPAYALLGDLTFLHDSTALVLGPDEPRPDLTLVVLNDDGGGIFSLLEQGGPEHAGAFERVFGTPHGVDLAALCAATRTPHTRISPTQLPAAVALPGGLSVQEVRGDRSALRVGHADLRAAVRAAARTALGSG